MVRFSVVIPTIVRPALARAVRAARAASGQDVEIIVVVDRAEGDADLSPDIDADRILFTGGVKRGGAARNMGVEAATGEWIAFLDDDDYWAPGRLDAMWAAMCSHGTGMEPNSEAVYASRVWNVSEKGVLPHPVPATPIQPGEDVASYLFKGRGLSLDRPSVFTSTLIVHRDVAGAVAWDPHLTRHQDWDLLIRFHETGLDIVQFENVDTYYQLSGAGSVSASANWQDSLAWWQSNSEYWPRAASVDFVVGQPLRYALHARSLVGVRACLSAAISVRRLPSPQTVARALTGLVPRAHLARAVAAAKVKGGNATPKGVHS